MQKVTSMINHEEIIKKILKDKNISQRDFCKSLGVLPQNFEVTFMRQNINTRYQNKILEVYEIDVTVAQESPMRYGDNNCDECENDLRMEREKNKDLTNEVNELRKEVIDLYRKINRNQ